MSGMSRHSGQALDGLDHIRQSVADILGTPIGSRVGRREYGSLLPDLIDQPFTQANIQRLYAATAVAIGRHEPRLRLRSVELSAGATPGARPPPAATRVLGLADARARPAGRPPHRPRPLR